MDSCHDRTHEIIVVTRWTVVTRWYLTEYNVIGMNICIEYETIIFGLRLHSKPTQIQSLKLGNCKMSLHLMTTQLIMLKIPSKKKLIKMRILKGYQDVALTNGNGSMT